MSTWEPTGQAGWDEDGQVYYHVANGNQEASAGDVKELDRIFDSHDALHDALSECAKQLSAMGASGHAEMARAALARARGEQS